MADSFMRNEKWRLNILPVVFLVIVVFLAACSSKSSIVGNWQSVTEWKDINFVKDGTFIVQNEGITAIGTWAFIDEKRIKIAPKGRDPEIFSIAVRGDQLEMIDLNTNLTT
jgi:hypothetical protein